MKKEASPAPLYLSSVRWHPPFAGLALSHTRAKCHMGVDIRCPRLAFVAESGITVALHETQG